MKRAECLPGTICETKINREWRVVTIRGDALETYNAGKFRVTTQAGKEFVRSAAKLRTLQEEKC